jgi:Zn-dependent protease
VHRGTLARLPDIDFSQLFIDFVVLIASLTMHEAAHAWTSDRLGDPTARLLGRVSLNPAVHVDPIGTILFPLIAMISRVPLIGWAKPVPVDIRHLRGNWRQKFMIIAAAGPASNLLLAGLGIAVFKVLVPVEGPVEYLLLTAIEINVLLAVFNMLPVPPLDGGNVLAGLLRGGGAEMLDRVRPYGFIILYGLMFTGVLTTIIRPVYGWVRFLLYA